jgi:hypothetical protein
MAEPISRYKRRANEIEQEIAARYPLKWSGWTRQEQLEKLNSDMRWRFFSTQAAKVEKEDLSPTDFFKAAQAGPYILPSTTAGDPGPGYTGVGMDPKFQAQRRLLEDEEEMYQRSGIFRMTPYGWPQ